MWKDISEVQEEDNVPGVYAIRLVYRGTNIPVVIQRFKKQDSSGILMIGHASKINDRIKDFRKAYKNGNASHSEGLTLFLVKKFFCNQQFFYDQQFDDIYSLQYCFIKIGTKKEAEQTEEEQLQQYFRKFGEVPPLNANLPGRDGWIEEIIEEEREREER